MVDLKERITEVTRCTTNLLDSDVSINGNYPDQERRNYLDCNKMKKGIVLQALKMSTC